ncbi:class I SAM-dependent methyltransferase [Marinomonas algicola]|uniref:class I SAM-dependent methyltransferase n=1 Tax=Marinomonas algicola TaxID=2773454 RepID=UPI0019D52B06|nr:methyltransferase domain-containing protein [Marinomonas algicola]
MTMSAADLAILQPTLVDRSDKIFLNVGCGDKNNIRLPECFQGHGWHQVRLDIDPSLEPDIVADITDLSHVKTNSVDAIYSSHNLEHLNLHQVDTALKQILNTLKPGGFFLVTLPDIQVVAEWVAEGKLMEVMYQSPMGPIRPIDVLFGHQGAIEKGNQFMAHKCGFDKNSLAEALTLAGFQEVRVMTDEHANLWGYAVKK